jgi:hypothetical protein
VWELVKKYLVTPGLIEREFDRVEKSSNADLVSDELKSVGADLKAAEQKLERYMEAFAEADSTDLRNLVKHKIVEQKKTIAGLTARTRTLEHRLRPYRGIGETKARTLGLAERLKQGIDDLDERGKRQVMDGLGITVRAYKGQFRILMCPPIELSAVSAEQGVALSSPCKTARSAP